MTTKRGAQPGSEQSTSATDRLRWLVVPSYLVLTACIAYAGSRFMPDAWYSGLSKPAWNPPSWVFGPVWAVLYLMIAIAGALTFLSRPAAVANTIWLLQLGLNGVWSFLFFGLHRPDLALIDIALLWLTIGAFVVAAWPISRTASRLFLPYWAWVSFASALNFEIWRLNS